MLRVLNIQVRLLAAVLKTSIAKLPWIGDVLVVHVP